MRSEIKFMLLAVGAMRPALFSVGFSRIPAPQSLPQNPSEGDRNRCPVLQLH